ncbi:MAG: divalent-cation tolerance protein CutA [Bdellovibrionales bacterium]
MVPIQGSDFSHITIFTTWPSEETAKAAARSLIERKLSACANIFSSGTSIYSWKNEIHEDTEVFMFLKTTRKLFEANRAEIAKLHPYDCPCIVGFPIANGEKSYLDWIKTQTTKVKK